MSDCPQGLRQGCVLSSTLFSIVINQIATSVAKRKARYTVAPWFDRAFNFCSSLMTWHSCHVRHMDTKHNLTVCIDCLELGLKINTEKSKIMVFRKGGFLGRYEQWSIDGNQLEVVNKYVYLGFTFTTSMSLQESAKQLALKGKRTLFDVLRLHS